MHDSSHLIFVNYRGTDEMWATEVVYARMTEAFGPDAVFKAGNALRFGDDYAPILRREAADCPVMLACIGPDWLETLYADGGRRLDAVDDWVRTEIAISLSSGNRVIPILFGNHGGMSLPKASDLPDDIRPLVERQAWRLVPGSGLDLTVPKLVAELTDLVPQLRECHLARKGAADRTSGTSVEGDENRIAAAGSHNNRFGDRRIAPPSSESAKSTSQSPAPTGPGVDGGLRVRGNRNRVAGPGAHENDFGDS